MKRVHAIIAAVVLLSATMLYAAWVTDSWNGFTLSPYMPGECYGGATLSYPALNSGESATLEVMVFYSGVTYPYEAQQTVNGPCAAGVITLGQGSPGHPVQDITCWGTCVKDGQSHDLYGYYYPD